MVTAARHRHGVNGQIGTHHAWQNGGLAAAERGDGKTARRNKRFGTVPTVENCTLSPRRTFFSPSPTMTTTHLRGEDHHHEDR
jgi:hypothetical protein